MYKRRNTRGDGAQHEVTLAFTCQCGCDFPKAQPMHQARGPKQSDTPINIDIYMVLVTISMISAWKACRISRAHSSF